MKIGQFVAAGAVIIALMTSAAASAQLLEFDFSGPSGTAVFDLDSNPSPDFASSFLGSDQFGFHDVAGTFGGIAGTASTISFGNGLFASLNIVAPNLGFTQFSAPTLFSGTPQAPTFLPGSYVLVNPFFGNGSLTIVEASGTPGTGAVPEPASWALLLAGFAAVGTAARHRRRAMAAVAG